MSLLQTANSASLPQVHLVAECLAELWVALEELRVAEEELLEQNEELIATRHTVELERQRYQDLFEFAPDGYLVTDKHGMIQEANQAAAAMLNFAGEHLVGKPIIIFVAEEHRRSFLTVLSQLPTIQRLQEWEVRLQGRNGTSFEAALTVEAKRKPGDVISVRWLLRDISQRKATEAQLQQIQLQNLQLIEADRLKSQFLSTISHELRTPLTGILGYSELLRRYFWGQKLEAAEFVEIIFRNGRNLLRLIEEILDFSKLQSGRLSLRPEAFDVMEVAREVMEDVRSLSLQKHLDLRLEGTNFPLMVINDPQRLRQVLLNLLSNAIKFTDVGSVVLEIWDLPREQLCICVRDTGIGIALADQTQIFQEFWQVNQTTTRRHGGTGLGLPITHALVKLMQGTIEVESQVGRGSTFRVVLPRQVTIS